MVSDRELGTSEIIPMSAKLRHGRVDGQQSFRGHGAQRNNGFRIYHGDLTHQERRAGLALIALRLAISRRAAFDDVSDVNLFPAQAHGFDHVGEQLSGAAYEWLALHVFVSPRSFTDKHEICIRLAHVKDDLLAALLVQLAARAV